MQYNKRTSERIQQITITPAVYLLLGALTITAELNKRPLSLLHLIAMNHNNPIREIAWRYRTAFRPNSVFKNITDILDMDKRMGNNIKLRQRRQKSNKKVRMLTDTYIRQILNSIKLRYILPAQYENLKLKIFNTF